MGAVASKSDSRWSEGRGERVGGMCGMRGAGTHTRKGSLGSEVSVILKVTFDMAAGAVEV